MNIVRNDVKRLSRAEPRLLNLELGPNFSVDIFGRKSHNQYSVFVAA
jgi:hypothetical protein